MAMRQIDATGKHWQGFSSDDMPTGVDDGTKVHLLDEGEVYIYHDGTWEQDLRLIAALRAL